MVLIASVPSSPPDNFNQICCSQFNIIREKQSVSPGCVNSEFSASPKNLFHPDVITSSPASVPTVEKTLVESTNTF